MLRHLDEEAAADKVQKALETVYTERKTLTRDVGGNGRNQPVCRRGAGGDGISWTISARKDWSNRQCITCSFTKLRTTTLPAARSSAMQHLDLAWKASERGELVLGGALANPVDGAMLLFKGDSPEVAARTSLTADPYVLHGIVKRWYVREWTTVAGEGSSRPVRPGQAQPAGLLQSGVSTSSRDSDTAPRYLGPLFAW